MDSKKFNMDYLNFPKTVDVIIPIYNALEYLKLAVKSVLEKDAQFSFRLILINDASPDKNISIFLKSIKDPRVILLENKENLGFVGTCNKGIEFSENDVILLNSDTEVTEGWIKRMVDCAYSKEKVATVSPFTNAGAGILNVPDYFKNNSIPEGYDLDSWDKVINEISIEKYPETYSNVGYCFFMSRNAINEIGALDHEAFGKGNGEESDFCLRARRNGYVNLICDNLLIQHEGASVSFKEQPQMSDSKKALVEKNTKIINSRYPEFQPWLENFLSKDPIADIHANIWFASTFFSSKKRIAHVINQSIDVDFGGIEIYVRQIASNLSDYDHYTINIQNDYIELARINKAGFQKLFLPLTQKLNTFKLSNNKLEENFKKALKIVNPNLVHFHGFQDKPVSIISIPSLLGITSALTTHDFGLFYPPYWQFNIKNGESIWKAVDSVSKPDEKEYYSKRKSALEKELKNLNFIIANSEYVKEKLELSFNENISKKVVNIDNAIKPIKASMKSSNEKLRIGWLGTFTKHKGAVEFLETVEFDKSKEFEWHIWGHVDNSDPVISTKLNALADNKNVFIHGKYSNSEVENILSTIDIVLMPSQVSETFSYALSELLSSGVHVIATNSGAIGFRLTKYKVGDVITEDNFSKKAFELLKSYSKDTKKLRSKREAALKVKLFTLKEHMDKLKELYTRNLSEAIVLSGSEKKNINFLRINSIYFTNNQVYLRTSWKDKTFYQGYLMIKKTPAFGILKKVYKLIR